MTYALLIYRATAPEHPIPELDDAAALSAHQVLQAELRARGELRAVARLDDVRRARTLVRRGDAHAVSDGPYVETKEWLIGFYLVDCDSEEEALARAKVICPDGHHAIEVRPVTWKWER